MIVDRDGRAKQISILRALGAGLDEEAVKAVSGWKFEPGKIDGVPVQYRVAVEINYLR
jgi:TonB family protein